MFTDKAFSDSYDLYRPTRKTSHSRVQTYELPSTATASDQPCLFFPKPGRFSMGERGPEIEYDARMLVPNAQTLYPENTSDNPDVVLIGDQYYVVLVAWDAAGQGHYKVVLLRQRRA